MKFKDMNLPNKLTTIRMFCVPLVVVLFVLHVLFKTINIPCDYYVFVNDENYLTINQIVIAVVFALASITDFVDGYIARKKKIVSDYGKLMDPLADKLLVNSTILFLLATGAFIQEKRFFKILGIIAMVMAIIVIIRDVFVDALRMQALKKNVVVSASIWGKFKTATLMPAIVCAVLGSCNVVIYAIGLILISFGGLFALIGGIKYFTEMYKYLGE